MRFFAPLTSSTLALLHSGSPPQRSGLARIVTVPGLKLPHEGASESLPESRVYPEIGPEHVGLHGAGAQLRAQPTDWIPSRWLRKQ